jgi:hypothetical protein
MQVLRLLDWNCGSKKEVAMLDLQGQLDSPTDAV